MFRQQGFKLCAEGTEWWKKARQKQVTSKQQEPLFNEFVDEEVSIKPTLQATKCLNTFSIPSFASPALCTDDCMACMCLAVKGSNKGTF